MAFRTTTTAQLVHAYLTATGDNLTAATCRALSLPSGKHLFHDLRHRLVLLACPGSSHSGNNHADQGEGSRLSAAASLKLVIYRLPEDEFTTADIRERIRFQSATLSKALRTLEKQGFIERIPSPRPYRYRRIEQPRPDFIMVFMTAHGLHPSTSTSLPLGHLPLLANRALCGLSIDGIELAEVTTDLTARYTGVTLSVPPMPALIPLLLGVLNGGGDFRSALRGMRTALQEAHAVKRCWERLDPEEAKGSPLAAFLLPVQWMELLNTQGGLGTFIEAGTQALGGELYPAKALSISDRAVSETIKALKTAGIAVSYDTERKLLTGLDEAAGSLVEGILRARVAELARKVSLPARMVSVSELYRRATLELGYANTLSKNKKLQ